MARSCCLSAPPHLHLNGCVGLALVGPEASVAWGAPAPSLPSPGYSPVSLVPKPRPCPTPPTPELLNSLVGLPWPPAPYLPWNSLDFRFLETVVQLGSLPAAPVVSLSRSPSPSAARLSAQALLGPPASWQDLSFLLIVHALVLSPSQATGLCRWDLSVGCRASSASHPQTGLCEALGWARLVPGAMLCGGGQVGKL